MNQLIWTVGIWIQFAKTSISNYLKIQYITLNWKKTFCKQFYKHFVEEIKIEPTAIKSWWKNCPEVANNWVNCIQNIYKIKLIRQFYFKLLHRILVANKELNRFEITDRVKKMCSVWRKWLYWTCILWLSNSFEITWRVSSKSLLKLCDKSLQW